MTNGNLFKPNFILRNAYPKVMSASIHITQNMMNQSTRIAETQKGYLKQITAIPFDNPMVQHELAKEPSKFRRL